VITKGRFYIKKGNRKLFVNIDFFFNLAANHYLRTDVIVQCTYKVYIVCIFVLSTSVTFHLIT